MSKRNKSNKPNIPTLYTKRAFEKDIKVGVTTYVNAIGMVVKNTKIIELVKNKLEANTTLEAETRQEFIQVIGMMLQNTHKTIDALEAVERKYLNSTPTHFPRDDSNVNKWVLEIQAQIIDSCEWITELTPVYQTIVEALQLSAEHNIANPAPKKEEA